MAIIFLLSGAIYGEHGEPIKAFVSKQDALRYATEELEKYKKTDPHVINVVAFYDEDDNSACLFELEEIELVDVSS